MHVDPITASILVLMFLVPIAGTIWVRRYTRNLIDFVSDDISWSDFEEEYGEADGKEVH